jgi:hypothetical protein
MLKEIYSFTVEETKEVEQKTKEKRKNDQGIEEEVEVTKKVKKEIPYTIIVKDPSRRELEEADMEYSIEMSRCIKKGILTKAMLAKKYSDTGGLLSESDATKLVDLYGELNELETEYTKTSLANRDIKKLPKKKQQELNEINGKLALVRRDIVNLEAAYQSLFNHTADTKAQNRIVLWYLTNLSFYKCEELEINEPTPLFPGEDFEQKIDDYYAKDEAEDSLFQAAAGKLTSIISYWYFSTDPTEKDYKKIVNDIDVSTDTETAE